MSDKEKSPLKEGFFGKTWRLIKEGWIGPILSGLLAAKLFEILTEGRMRWPWD